MALPTKQTVTPEAFYTFAHKRENADKRFELIDGEIIALPSNSFASVVAMRIVAFISLFLMQHKVKGYVSGEGGGYLIDGNVFAPDVAYVRELPAKKGFEPTPPPLVVEVLSDPGNSTEQTDLRRKLAFYLKAGVVVWVVDYVARQVEVHRRSESVLVLGDGDRLTGGDVLPGFTIAITDIFPDESAE